MKCDPYSEENFYAYVEYSYCEVYHEMQLQILTMIVRTYYLMCPILWYSNIKRIHRGILIAKVTANGLSALFKPSYTLVKIQRGNTLRITEAIILKK